MKPIKLFSTLKSGVGAAALAIAAFAFYACNNFSTLPETSSTIFGVKTLDPPIELKASNGGKRKITLSWNVVSVAKFYRIYCSDSPNGDFAQVGESIEASYEDAVASGRTYYYKVSAVNGIGQESTLSEIVKGTSLATPIISNIDEHDTYATIDWYTENSSSYEEITRFEVHCADGNQDRSMVVDGTQSSYTFENLSANTTYQFYVEIYTIKDPDSVEKSPTVTKNTYAQYTPVSPDFIAEQGMSTSGIRLNITLPSKVQVAIEAADGSLDIVDCPLYFEVYRKRASESIYPATPLIKKLYFNATTSGTPNYADYSAGDIVSYEDTSVTRGIKYEYQIKSYIDLEYPDLVSKGYNKVLGSKKGKTSIGWAAAIPTFEIINYKRVKSDNGTPDETSDDFISNISVQYSASWDDMGKASVYRYAIQEKFKKESDPSLTATTWVTDASGNKMFASLAAVNEITKSFDLTQNASEKVGNYDYALYIIPETDADGNAITEPTDDASKILTFVSASSAVTVSNRVNMPSTTFTSYKGGWTNKTQLAWPLEDEIQYSLKRGVDNEDKANWTTISWDTIKATISNEGVYEDTSVESGHTYTYELYANGTHNTGIAVSIKTLGTANPVFNTYDYDSVKVTWNDTAVQCAAYYEVTLGNANTVGGGASAKLIVTANDKVEIEGSTFDANTSASIEGGEIALTITKPENYDDATISGIASNLTIKAYSDLDSTDSSRSAAKTSSVRTLGPAAITTTASVAKSDDTITVEWNKVDGAKAYLIRRDRMDSQNKEIALSDSYIIPETGGPLVAGFAEVSVNSEGKLVLTDTSKANSGTAAWDKNQERLAWGYPYRYTIFPLLKADESVDVSEPSTVISDAGIAYKKETALSATGSTNGYGMNVLATKSQDPHKVKITWTTPYNINGKAPKLWRSKNATTWTKVDATAAGDSFIITPTGDDRVTPFYYAVSYASDDNTVPHSEYTKEISLEKDLAYSPLEAKNFGYPFALKTKAENVPTSTGKAGFKEVFSYTLWNYEERRQGPDLKNNYTVSVKNNNYGPGYNDIAKISSLKLITFENLANYDIKEPEKTGNGELNQTITLAPKNVDSDDNAYNTGLLSVLRDYKHYYKLGAKRALSDSENAFVAGDAENRTIEASWCDDETKPVYAYRNITNAELARAAMLAMTYGFFRVSGGNTDYSNMGSCYVKQEGSDPAGGTFSNSDGTVGGVYMGGKYYHTFGIAETNGKKYSPAMLTPGGTQNNVVAISTTSQKIQFWRQGLNEGFYCFQDSPILNVVAADSEVGDIYNATITVTNTTETVYKMPVIGTVLGYSYSDGSGYLNITVQRTYSNASTTINASNQDQRREYFPIQFGTDRNWDFKNSKYGWWGKKTN